MNFLEMLLQVDKAESNISENDPYIFSEAVGLTEAVGWTTFNDHVKGYWVRPKLSHDTWVGLAAIYLDDELVATTNQLTRKGSGFIRFLNTTCAEKMKQFILMNVADSDNHYCTYPVAELFAPVSDGYTVSFSDQLLDSRGFYNGKPVTVAGVANKNSLFDTAILIKFDNESDRKLDPLLIESLNDESVYVIEIADFIIPNRVKK
jgi:hypothetical protein